MDRQHPEIVAPNAVVGGHVTRLAKFTGAWHKRLSKTVDASGHYRTSDFLRFFGSEKRLDQSKTEVDRGAGAS
jgi:hypothetical protein